jgi:hypothetical protein
MFAINESSPEILDPPSNGTYCIHRAVADLGLRISIRNPKSAIRNQ